MGITTAVTTCFQKYVDFQGRARRSEFWWWILFVIIVEIVARILDGFVDPPAPGVMFQYGFIYGIAVLALLLPNITVAVRRLHDIGRSGWWLLLCFIPIIGWLVLLFWYVSKGTDGNNRFGPDPKKAM